MKTAALLLLLLLGALPCARAQAPAPAASPAPAPPAPALRSRLSDVVGALANEGFNLRDGSWAGKLESGKAHELPVHLFAGNQYWFCAALSPGEGKPRITLGDSSGAEVKAVSYSAPDIAAVGVTAPSTGRYVLSIRYPAPGAREFSLLYLYK